MASDIWGLLGPSARYEALGSGLLNLGGGLLAAGAPSNNPALSSRGLIAGTQGFNQGIEDYKRSALQSLLVGKQMDEEKRKEAERAARAAALKALIEQRPELANLAAAAPEQVTGHLVGQAFPKQLTPKEQIQEVNGQLLNIADPNNPRPVGEQVRGLSPAPAGMNIGPGGQVSAAPGFMDFERTRAMAEAAGRGQGGLPYQAPVPGGQPGASFFVPPNSAWAGGGAPSGVPAPKPGPTVPGPRVGGGPSIITTPNNPAVGETAEQAARAKDLATEHSTVRQAASAATETLDLVRMQGNIEAQTGALSYGKMLGGRWADALGMGENFKSLVSGANDLIGYNSITKRMVLSEQLKQKGIQTEGDARRMEETMTSITNPEESNKFVQRIMASQARRAFEKSGFYDAYLQENGTTNGAATAWSKYTNSTPLTARVNGKLIFLDEAMTEAQRRGVDPSQALNDWRKYAK